MLRLTAAAVVVVWLPIYLVWGPAPFALTFDDAYYYLQIGRELAHGHGSTFNGLDHTNGYHPLWQVVSILPFLVGLTGLAAVRALLVVQLGLWFVTLWIVAGLVGKQLTRVSTPTVAVLFALVAANPYVMKLFVNGLESGVAALAYAALLWAVVEKRTRWIAPLLVLAFLSRTDAVIVMGCLFLWSPREWRRFVPAGVVVALYLGFNQVVFGNPLQVSGVVKRLPLTATRAVELLVVAVVALAVGVGCRRLAGRTGRFERTIAFLAATGWFAAACVLLVGYYRVLSVEVYLWYYAPIALYLFVVLLHLAGDFAEAVVAEGQSLRTVQVILVLPFLAGFLLTARQVTDPHLRSLQEGDRAAALWVRDNTPPDTRVASWDAGIIGYFSDRPVVNLDGVVNSFEWHDATKHAPAATSHFLAARHITITVNHGVDVNGHDPDIQRNVDALWGPGSTVTLLHAELYRYDGSLGGHPGPVDAGTFVYQLVPAS